MQKAARANGENPTDSPPEPHVVEDIESAAESVPSADAASAALRSILIGAVLVSGLTWLARMVFRRRKGNSANP